MISRALDFDGNKPRMYKELRESTVEIYQDVDVKIFGPVNVTDFSNKNIKSNLNQNKNRNNLERGKRTHDKR